MLLSRDYLKKEKPTLEQKLDSAKTEYIGELFMEPEADAAMPDGEAKHIIKKLADKAYISKTDFYNFNLHARKCASCTADLKSMFKARTSE